MRTALEIGAGTGKATRVFARRGIAVTASDPDREMLAELSRHVPEAVSTLVAAFEDLPTGTRYDLVFAAASFHWTDPDGRWSRLAALLEPGGVFASFGGQVHLADPELARAVQDARSPFLAEDEVPSPDGTPTDSPLQWPGTELSETELFTDVRQSVIERRITAVPDEYVGHLATVSAYLELPAPVREQALTRILEVLPDSVPLVADLTLHLARRA